MSKTVTITIKGLGMTIAKEVYFIAEVLKEKNYNVEIIDEHPPEKEFDPKNVDGSNTNVKIIANHLPWGG